MPRRVTEVKAFFDILQPPRVYEFPILRFRHKSPGFIDLKGIDLISHGIKPLTVIFGLYNFSVAARLHYLYLMSCHKVL